MKSAKEQFSIIKKGAIQIISEEDLMEKLTQSVKEDRPLTIKFGLDPSAPDIHLGHTVALRKIRQLQDLGHKVVIIIGDFTGQIGDPTGRSKARKALSKEQVKENAATYMEQIFKVIDPSKTEVRFNSEWLEKLNFEEVIRLASTTTVARMLERDDFKKRYQENTPIGLHEFFYPLMQAYDSVEIQADIELGGTEQTFNVLMGRALQKAKGMREQTAIFMPLLEGLDGVEKMSKSLGNYICVDEVPEVMFKKVMEVPDSLIIRYFTLVTDVDVDTIEKMEEEMKNGRNPREIKIELAKEITRMYHGEEAMQKAFEYFENVFREGKAPDEMPEIKLEDGEDTLLSLVPKLIEKNLVASGSEFRRLIKQGGVMLNKEKLMDVDLIFVEEENVLKIGKKKFVRIKR